MVINAAKPFLSSEDIGKGARWSAEVAAKLETSKVGIICLTPGNMNSSWVLFEAGALSKVVGDTHVCPLLIGLKPSDVKGPLSQFQFTTTSKPDMLQLVKTLNTAASEAGVPTTQLEKVFEALWPQLEEQLKKAPMEESKGPVRRSVDDMLEELLERVRNLGRSQQVDVARGLWEGLMSSRLIRIRNGIDQLLSPFLAEQGDHQLVHSMHVVGPDVWEYRYATDKGFRFLERVPATLDDAEMTLKIRERFVNLYKDWVAEATKEPRNA